MSSGSARRSTSPTRRTSRTRCVSTRMLEAIDSCPAPCGLLRPRIRARRRLRARRLRRRRGRVAGRRVRLHGGPARDHPGGHLAVRAPEDRGGRTTLLRHGRAIRRGGGASDRSGVGGGGGRRRARRVGRRATSSPGGPIAVREAKRLVRERPQGEATAQHRRRAPNERRGPGRAARVPRAPLRRLARAGRLVQALAELRAA